MGEMSSTPPRSKPATEGEVASSCAKRQRLEMYLTPPRSEPAAEGKALRCATSPIVVSAVEAIDAYRRNPTFVCLRPVENRHLSVDEAEQRKSQGGDLLVTPYNLQRNEFLRGLNTAHKEFANLDIQALRNLVKPIEIIYRDFLGVSWRFAETDNVSMVVYTLDYYVKRRFYKHVTYYESLFVPYLFRSTRGNNVRYFDIYREYEKLRSFRSLSPHEQQVYDGCNELLTYSERKVVKEFGLKFSGRNVRSEMQSFLDSQVRSMRMFGTHCFTSMLWEDFTKPLTAQQLSDNFPRPKLEAFKFNEFEALKAMLVRALVLKDLRERFSRNELDPSCSFTHRCGLSISEKFMSRHVPYSFKVIYKSISAIVVKENESEGDITPAHVFNLEHFDALV